MSQHFYRDIKIIKACRLCDMTYRPLRGSINAGLGLCHSCRPIYWKEKSAIWWKNLSPEAKARIKKNKYEAWLKWVEENKDKRRSQSLTSYHKNKKKKSNIARREKYRKEYYQKEKAKVLEAQTTVPR